MQGTDLTIDQLLERAVRRSLRRRPALLDGAGAPTGGPATGPALPEEAAEAAIHVQVHDRWVCVSRLVNRVSCCRESLAWSAGWVVRRFDAVAARPIGIEDRRHSCGRTPDAVDVTDRFHPGEETVGEFCERIANELQEALAAAAARTRAGHRGAAVAIDRRNRAPQVLRRDFHLRTLDL